MMTDPRSDERIGNLLRSSRVIAVVGMKDESDPMAPAFGVPAHLAQLGYEVWPVNPTIAAALGRPSAADLSALSVVPDIVNVFRRNEVIPALVDEILALPADRRPRLVWFQTGIRDDEASARLEDAGIEVVQDSCLGVFASRYADGGGAS